MKVISRGIPPQNQTYTTTCRDCHSVLEFQKNEARMMSDRNETIYIITCPVCSKEIWIASRSWRHTPFRNREYYALVREESSWRHTPFRNWI